MNQWRFCLLATTAPRVEDNSKWGEDVSSGSVAPALEELPGGRLCTGVMMGGAAEGHGCGL